MFFPSFHDQIRQARKINNLKQRELSEAAGLPRGRLSHLELGRRKPSAAEIEILARVLSLNHQHLKYSPTRPAGLARKLRNEGRRSIPGAKPFFPPKDRANRVRYSAAKRRYPRLINGLTARICSRTDATLCAFFSEQVSCGSALECLYLVARLASGARGAWLPPLALGHSPLPIICPQTKSKVGHRPMPCLLDDTSFDFFQISMATPRIYTVDILRFEQDWKAIEIDGRGHDFSGDEERTQALMIPLQRLSELDVVSIAESVLQSGTLEPQARTPRGA